MNRKCLGASALALTLILSGGFAPAQQYDRSGQVIPGTEVDPKRAAPEPKKPPERLPEQPQRPPRAAISGDLVPIQWPHSEGGTAAVDQATVSVDPDEVVRYVMVAVGPDGKRQVTFEGVRCAPDEWRIYAFGQGDGIWAPNLAGRWQPAYEVGPGGPRHVLARDYFCTLGRRPAPDARDALGAGGGSSVFRRRE